MRFVDRAALLVVAVALFAGCGGGGGGSKSALPGASSGTALTPELNGGGPGTIPTLYVSGQGSVFAYDLGASGDTPPVSTAGGFYYQSAGNNHGSIAGIATNSIGGLVVVENYGLAGTGNSCVLAYIPPRTSGNAGTATSGNCYNGKSGSTVTPGTAVGVTFTGPPTGAVPGAGASYDDIDVLMHFNNAGLAGAQSCANAGASIYEVDRYHATSGSITPTSCVQLDQPTSAYAAISGGVNGTFFADYNSGGTGTIERYNSTGGSASNSATVPGLAGPMAVAVDYATNTGYRVVASNTGGVWTVYYYKVSGGTFTFTHSIGTFNNTIAALAVDKSGKVYVGVNQPNGVTKVKVYGPAKTEATAPDYILNNPVRRPNPAAPPAAAITGIAIAESNANPPATPSPTPTASPSPLVYVPNFGGQTVTVYNVPSADYTGAPIATLTSANGAHQVDLDSSRKVYSVDTADNNVAVYPALGPTPATTATPSGHVSSSSGTALSSPHGVAIQPSTQRIFVANGSSVLIYPSGSTGPAVPLPLTATPTPFVNAWNLAFDSSSNLYVSDNNGSVQKFLSAQLVTAGGQTPSLSFAANTPTGIAVDSSGYIYVVLNNASVGIYNPSGASIGSIPANTTTKLTNTGVLGVAIGPDDKIYVSDYGANAVRIFAAGTTSSVAPLASIVGASTGLSSPAGLIVK